MKLIAVLFLVCCTTIVHTQKVRNEELYYAFDKDWKPTQVESATYLSYVQTDNDTAWKWNNYHCWGSLITIETFRDAKGTMPHGYFAFFDKKGKIDSGGHYANGFREGEWYLYGDSIKPQFVREYSKGVLINERKAAASSAPPEAGDKEAEFKGGMKGWVRYLQSNLTFPKRAEGKRIAGMVVIGFVVNESGKLASPYIFQSVELSLDQEAVRLINKSPQWLPAQRGEQKLKAYRLQPITFALR